MDESPLTERLSYFEKVSRFGQGSKLETERREEEGGVAKRGYLFAMKESGRWFSLGFCIGGREIRREKKEIVGNCGETIEPIRKYK